MTKKRKHIITDNEYIVCPYCVEEDMSSYYKLKFLSNNHLKKVHDKTFDDLKREYPDVPTMTRDQQHKRSKARKSAQEKIDETYKQQKKKVGFANKETAEKTRNTIRSRYGTDNFMQTDEAKELFSGSNNPMSKENPDSKPRRESVSKKLKGKPSKLKDRDYEDIHGKEKAEQLKLDRSIHFKEKFMPDLQTCLDYLNLQLLDETYNGAHYKHTWKCNKCSTEFDQIWNAIQQGFLCPTCYPRFMGDSKSEREIRKFIESLGFKPIYNSRSIIKPKELDIFIPERNIAIEHNGIYIHSTAKISDKNYHINKTIECAKLGIRLIHIFEDEWVYKKNIVKERLKYILGVSTAEKVNGRDCIIKQITNTEKDEFLSEYHIQGPDIGSPIRLGAYHNDELVAVMTFSKKSLAKGSKHVTGHWELNRFCSNYSYHIHGIASKLLQYFKNNFLWDLILTYADLRWSNGNLYKTLGFVENGRTDVDYWYTSGSLQRISRFKMKKRPDEPKDIPEEILRLKEGYFRIYGCGNLRFTITK